MSICVAKAVDAGGVIRRGRLGPGGGILLLPLADAELGPAVDADVVVTGTDAAADVVAIPVGSAAGVWGAIGRVPPPVLGPSPEKATHFLLAPALVWRVPVQWPLVVPGQK